MAGPPHFTNLRPEPGKRAAWVLAAAVHVLLAAFLFYGVRWQASAPEAVSVDLVRYSQPTVADKPAAPPPPQEVQKPPEPVQKTVQKEEPPEPPKAEIQRKVPEIKPKPEKKPVPTENYDPIKKALEQATKRDTDLRMKDVLARVETQLKAGQAAQAAAARNKGLADYLAKVRAKVRGNIVLPPGIDGNPEIELLVTQLPSGEVLSVKFKTRSGNAALDTAVERAILKSSPLPKPDDVSLLPHELAIKYRPLED
jgi:colicin import membrane protein